MSESVWQSVSIPIRNGMVAWPGHPEPRVEPISRIAEGRRSNVTKLSISTHTGTHLDAPWHFEADGARLDAIDPSLYFGAATLLVREGVCQVTEEHLPDGALPERLLIRTDNSRLPTDGPMREDYVAVSEGAARRLVDGGVRLIGVDYLSVAPFDQASQATHHILLGHEIVIVEGLRLAGLAEGDYEFCLAPLPVEGGDGAPCGAFLRALG
jgi:arylformamidase